MNNKENFINGVIKKHGYVAVIAGGAGARLFPLSHKNRPKQFVPLNDDCTFIQDTVQRFLDVGFRSQNIIIVTATDRQTELAEEQLVEHLGILTPNIYQLDREDYDLGGAIHCAMLFIEQIDRNAVTLTTPSDQYVERSDDFEEPVVNGMQAAWEHKPTIVGVSVNDLVTFMGSGHAIYEPQEGEKLLKVQGFIEKPDEEKARKLMRQGNSSCNTAINCWRVDDFIKKLGRKPKPMGTSELMEKFLPELHLVVGKFRWNDCGTLKTYYQVSGRKSNHKNVYRGGRIVRKNLTNSFVHTVGNSVSFVNGGNSVAIVQHVVSGILVTVVCDFEHSQTVKDLADSYNKLTEVFMNNFTLEGNNNSFHTASMKHEAICGFVGVDNVTVVVEKDPQTGQIFTSVDIC